MPILCNRVLSLEELKEEFAAFYGNEPFQMYFSPGRVNLIGEHTDYNGGYVFPCALTLGTYCIIRENNSGVFRFRTLNYDTNELIEVAVEDIMSPLPNKSWVNYPLGVIAQFQNHGYNLKSGADILIYGNVPNGAGLSSSASLEVAVAVAINETYNFKIDRITLVKYCQKAENEFIGVMCGIMDQFASGLGQKDHAIYLNCDTLDYIQVPLFLDDMKIIISNTNSPHKLDSGLYNERVFQCELAVKALSRIRPIKKLGEITLNEFNEISSLIRDDTIRKRAHHVVSEIDRTKKAVSALQENDFVTFGKLMNASHQSLRNDYEVTGFHLDAMVDAAQKIKGTIGSRMTGGGFGGSTVSIVNCEYIDAFIEKVGEEYFKTTGIEADFYTVKAGAGGRRIS
ncbi:MAG: galactokinase [Bacteroidales bacterium]